MTIDWTKLVTAADKTAAARDAETSAGRLEAKAYLAETDWQVLRAIELGEAVPTELAAQRAAARLKASGGGKQ